MSSSPSTRESMSSHDSLKPAKTWTELFVATCRKPARFGEEHFGRGVLFLRGYAAAEAIRRPATPRATPRSWISC